jgi:hypothetical protein
MPKSLSEGVKRFVYPDYNELSMPIEQLLVYYFTGTGNSLRVAQWLVETARARGLIAAACVGNSTLPSPPL